MLREADERPREEAEDEVVDAGGAGGDDARDVLVGHERALEHRVVAARRAHAEHVPRVLDRVALRVARHEAVDDLRRRRVAHVHPVHAEARPHRRQAAERFASGESVAAVHASRPSSSTADRGCRCHARRARPRRLRRPPLPRESTRATCRRRATGRPRRRPSSCAC